MSINSNFISQRSAYPLSLSLGLIVGAVILSFVDLMFLNDIIGKILDIGTTESMFIAFTLGMVGIGVMAHLGAKVAYGGMKLRHALGHYALWVLLGIAFALIRFFSASILQLESASGDEALLSIFSMNVREVDLVIAPLMMLLYLATGIMVKDGFKQLHLNPDYDKWKADRNEAKMKRRSQKEQRRTKAEQKMLKAQEKIAKAQQNRMKELEESRLKMKADTENNATARALDAQYNQALATYNTKLNEMKDKYQSISRNINYIKGIDKQEEQFEYKIKPSLIKVVQGSLESTQNSVALAIRAKTKEDLNGFYNEIEIHNTNRKQSV